VAKREVANWPVFGFFAQMAGTIFVDRTRRMKVTETNGQIAGALHAGVVVVLFAEGTSSDGRMVLPFRSSLLEPAALCHGDLRPAAIRYQLDDGSVAREVCYWGEMTLLPHLLNLFSKKEVRSRIVFGATDASLSTVSRKDAARQLHQRVSQLYDPAFPRWQSGNLVPRDQVPTQPSS
jgi:1-acyl-sn-glycerol-3-phosphate acyltransferase